MFPPMIRGDHVFTKDEEFDGMIGGSAIIPAGVSVVFRGMVNGNLIVEKGGTVELWGLVNGRVIDHGTVIRKR